MAGAVAELAGVGKRGSNEMSGSVRSAAGLVWRHQRLLWWIFLLNLALAWLSSLPVRAMLRPVLDSSLESTKLVTGFDVSTFVLLLERPEAPVRALAPGALAAALLFLLAMLALDGGVLTVYLQDRRLDLAEFSARGGLYFWRMARLALYSLVPFGALAAAQSALGNYAGRLSRDAPQERLGFLVNVAGTLLILLAALLVRLWFDVAQARVVQGEERRLLRRLWRSFVPALRSGLYARYLGIAFFAVLSLAVGLWLWAAIPHRAIGASFALLELVTVLQIATRLWMKAASARWVALQPEDGMPTAALDLAIAAVAAQDSPQPK
jgi:hypothetical protein